MKNSPTFYLEILFSKMEEVKAGLGSNSNNGVHVTKLNSDYSLLQAKSNGPSSIREGLITRFWPAFDETEFKDTIPFTPMGIGAFLATSSFSQIRKTFFQSFEILEKNHHPTIYANKPVVIKGLC